MNFPESDFKHIFLPGDAEKPVLLLLHGTGGDENDLVPLGQAVAPDHAILSVRGRVLENGMPRFFRRLAEGVFDLDDLKFRTDELADFITAARDAYEIGKRPLAALGYSNGANIAASLFLKRPEVLDGAMLLRAMVPFEPDELPNLAGKKILMLTGMMDPIIPLDNSKKLAGMLADAGADLDFRAKPMAHGLGQSDLADMQNWFPAAFR
jgi:phospholipase/carboxylesterase